MSVKLLTEHHLEFLSLKGGSTGSSESTLVKMPHCWKSQVTAHFNSIMYIIITHGSLVITIQVKVVTERSKFHSLLKIRVKSCNLGHQVNSYLFHILIIGIKNELTKQTVKILMRQLIRSCFIWISTVYKRFRIYLMSEVTGLYPPFFKKQIIAFLNEDIVVSNSSFLMFCIEIRENRYLDTFHIYLGLFN